MPLRLEKVSKWIQTFKNMKKRDFCALRKNRVFFMFLKVWIDFETFPSITGIRQSCPKPSRGPKTSPKNIENPKTPKNPPEGGTLPRRGGGHPKHPRTPSTPNPPPAPTLGKGPPPRVFWGFWVLVPFLGLGTAFSDFA